MTPFKTDVNALRPAGQTTQPHLRASATNNKVTQALTLIHDRAATRISPAGAGTFKPLTAEQAAGNILGFIERQIHRDIANGATEAELQSRLEAGLSGFKKGFNEARERLAALNLLDRNVSAAIGKTYDLVTGGIDALAQTHLGRPLFDTAPLSASEPATAAIPSWTRYEYASMQSFRFELLTKEGDKVSIQATASQGETRFWRDEDGNTSTASSANISYNLSVTGDLSDAEKASINELLQQINLLAHDFFSGDIDRAFESALELGYDRGQIESFAFNLIRLDVQRANSAYGKQADAPNELQHRLRPLGQFIKNAHDVLNKASEFAEPHALVRSIVEGLYGDPEAPGNRDGKRFADFLSELLSRAAEANTELNEP